MGRNFGITLKQHPHTQCAHIIAQLNSYHKLIGSCLRHIMLAANTQKGNSPTCLRTRYCLVCHRRSFFSAKPTFYSLPSHSSQHHPTQPHQIIKHALHSFLYFQIKFRFILYIMCEAAWGVSIHSLLYHPTISNFKLLFFNFFVRNFIDYWEIMCNFAIAFCGNESARRVIN